MSAYKSLSPKTEEKIRNTIGDKFILADNAVRRNPNHDKANLWRPAYVRDAAKEALRQCSAST